MVPGVVLYHSYRAISMLDAIDHEGRATPEMIHKMVGEKLDEAAATATDRYDQNTGEHSEAKQTATDRYNQNSEEHMELLREVKRKAERAEEVCNENKEEMKKWLNRFEKRDER
jgi:gas vesicle protein